MLVVLAAAAPAGGGTEAFNAVLSWNLMAWCSYQMMSVVKRRPNLASNTSEAAQVGCACSNVFQSRIVKAGKQQQWTSAAVPDRHKVYKPLQCCSCQEPQQ
jgi:hypothetical protein